MGVLTVYLEKCTHLRDADAWGSSDPFVEIWVEQHHCFTRDKVYTKQRSTQKRNEMNPEYGETFQFKKLPSLRGMTLHFKVYDLDDNRRYAEEIGYARFNLNSWFIGETPRSFKRVVDAKKDQCIFARKALIHFTVSYTKSDLEQSSMTPESARGNKVATNDGNRK